MAHSAPVTPKLTSQPRLKHSSSLDSVNANSRGSPFTVLDSIRSPGPSIPSWTLVEFPHQLILTETWGVSSYSLVITRTSEFHISEQRSVPLLEGQVHPREIYGIVGIIKLLAGPYLILAVDVETIGNLLGLGVIYKLKEVTIVPIVAKAITALSAKEKEEEERYISYLTELLGSGLFVYSFTYDLSRSLVYNLSHGKESTDQDKDRVHEQENHKKKKKEKREKRLSPRSDTENDGVSVVLAQTRYLNNIAIPLTQAFVGIHSSCLINRSNISLALISRRSKLRAGTRFHRRGADESGNAANFVETEQIIRYSDGSFTSFLQTRGNIPLLWKQEINLDYEPKIVIDGSDKSVSPFKLHFDDHLKRYNRTVIVNLLKEHGGERPLSDTFHRFLTALNYPDMRYVYFDFHKVCGTTKFEKLSILVNDISTDITNMGYDDWNPTSAQIRKQNGIFRTNCKDCLDRTNVVQGLFGKLSLSLQLQNRGIIKDLRDMEVNNPSFMYIFRNMWADSGDHLSTFYAGTPAIRAGVTRYGKQSIKGLLDDGFNSATRYYLNQFKDGDKQDAIDLFLGNYVPARRISSPFSLPGKGILLWLLVLILSIFRSFSPAGNEVKGSFAICVAMFWVILFLLLTKVLHLFKRDLIVNKPRFTTYLGKPIYERIEEAKT